MFFFFSSRRRHTRLTCDWSSDVCSSDLNGDGTVQINLRGPFPRETLVLVDGKRVAFGSLAGAGSSEGEDINLIPFPMIDHIDILKHGASAVSGSDAIGGV